MNIPAARIVIPEDDRKWVLQQMEEIMTTGWLTLGKFNKQLEVEFSQRHQVKYAVAVNSGTSSIEIPLRIFGIEGREVLVPTNTFFATAAAVLHAGGKVRFVDADSETFSISLDALKERVTRDTVGVIVVHIAGIVTPQMAEIKAFCEEQGIFLFEDAAHAHGASYDGQMAGTFGQAASFSFYPTKVITSAEGGMIVTNDQHIYEEALIYRDQGKAGFLTNFHTRLGYNWRMSEPHAVIGLSQLHRLNEFVEQRRKIARIYDEGLRDIEGVTPLLEPEGCYSNYYKYIALLDRGIDRAALKKLLKEEYQISLSGEVYDTPCHRQPIFEPLSQGQFPVADDICARHICLPLFVTMTKEEVQYVLNSLSQALKEVAS